MSVIKHRVEDDGRVSLSPGAFRKMCDRLARHEQERARMRAEIERLTTANTGAVSDRDALAVELERAAKTLRKAGFTVCAEAVDAVLAQYHAGGQ